MTGDDIWPLLRTARKFAVRQNEVRVHLTLDRPVALVAPGILGLLAAQQQLDDLANSVSQARPAMLQEAAPPLMPVAWARSDAESGDLIALQLKVNTLQYSVSTSLWLKVSPRTLDALAASGHRPS